MKPSPLDADFHVDPPQPFAADMDGPLTEAGTVHLSRDGAASFGRWLMPRLLVLTGTPGSRSSR